MQAKRSTFVNISLLGETSEAIGVRTQRDTRRAGALMANTDGLFGASAGEFTRQVKSQRSDYTGVATINSEELYPRPMHLASSEKIINIVQNKIEP